MRKIIGLIISIVMLLSIVTFTYAEGGQAITIRIDGVVLECEVQPYIDERGTTFVPLREISEALGATVGWDGDTSTITLKKGNDIVKMQIGVNKVEINGLVSVIDTAPVLADGFTYVPLRLSANALRAEVSWDGNTRAADINTTSLLAQVAQIPAISYFAGNNDGRTDNYMLQIPGKIGIPDLNIKYTNPITGITMLSIKEFTPENLAVVKKIFEIYYPESYEAVYDIFKDSLDNGTRYSRQVYDGRKITISRFTYGKDLYNMGVSIYDIGK